MRRGLPLYKSSSPFSAPPPPLQNIFSHHCVVSMFSLLRSRKTFTIGLFGEVLRVVSRWQQLSSVGSSHLLAPNSESIDDLHSNSFKNIEVTTVGKVLVIGLNRPAYRNAVNRETAGELYQAFRLFDSDENVDVGVLYGKGGTFCSGYDLKEIAGATHQQGNHPSAKSEDRAADSETQSGIEWLLHACDIRKDFAPMVCPTVLKSCSV